MKLRRANDGKRALTLIEVLVVILVVVVLVGLFWSNEPSAKPKALRINCAINLKQIGQAFRNWEEDNHTDHFPMRGFTNQLGTVEYPKPSNMFRYFQVMSNGLSNPKILVCPSDKRSEADNFSQLRNSNLSYFVGLNAVKSYPAMLLTGDRNLIVDGAEAGPGLLTLTSTNQVGWSATMHNFGGNVGLADGSVQQVTSSGLRRLLEQSGTNVNRLVVP